MQRVLVIGAGGSGKTRLARRLGEITSLPVIHLDALYWRRGWTATPDAEWRRTVERLVAGERWIMDGNYGGTLDIRLAACDAVVFLDVPRRVTIPRLIRRWLTHRGTTRPEMGPGCPERLTWEFLRWVWTYPRRRRPGILRQLAAPRAGCRVRVLRDDAEVREFLSEVRHEHHCR